MPKLAQVIGVVLFAAAVAGLLAPAANGRVADRPGLAAEARAAQLERDLGPGVRVEVHGETGRVRFIGTEPGRPIPRPLGLGPDAAPADVARAFLDSVGPELGLKRGSRDLRAIGSSGEGGDTAVRFQQLVGGVPVIAGELVVSVDRRGDVLSASGELEPDGVDTTPGVDGDAARRVALASVAKGAGRPVEDLEADAPSLAIYDPRLLGGPGLGVPLLVWRIEVGSTADRGLRRLVLVDARLGLVAESLDLVPEAKDRRVCDAANTAGDYPCAPPYHREEGDGATGNADVDAAYDFAGDTYDFFFGRFGYDSLDGAGLPLTSTVRYCPEEECPYANAFWDGSQMVYGEGFAAADDVVGHELSHGFTQFNSNLFYWYQSGAINESMSDVFGELVDLTNGAGDDSAGARWLLGEDVPGFGALRDMQNPPAFGDPDRMASPKYVADVNQFDNGGVHTNSGVNNKAAYLIVDGDTFNGETVTGIGVDKAARVYFAANSSLLTSGSDYADLHAALRQACANSVGGAEGITEADCEQVAKAVDATEMDMDPLVAPAPEAPVCAAGGKAVDLFYDDLENTGSGNWAHSASLGTDRWFYPQNPNPFSPSFDATYATSGETNFWGYDQPSVADFSVAQTADVAIPAGTVYMRFSHSYAFEDGFEDGSRYDGGQLEYSVDGGSSWQDAEPLFTHNGYNGTIATGFENPLAGEAAFTAESQGYISSRVDLSSLAGEEVRFRFRIGTDESVDDYGWFVDDVRIYECEGIEPPPPDETPPETTIVAGPAHGSTTSDSTPTFAFASDEEPVSFECSLDGAAFAPCVSPHTTPPLAEGVHSFRVQATDAAENTDPTPAVREFAVELPEEETPPPFATPTPIPTASEDFVDRRAPRTALFGRRWQIAGRPVVMRVRCDEPCVAVARGRAVLWRKARGASRAQASAMRQVKIGLRSVTRRLAAGRTSTIGLRPKSRRAARRLKRMVESGWKARVVVVVRFRDDAGNPAVERTVIRLRSGRG